MTKEDVYTVFQFLGNPEIQSALARQNVRVDYKRLFDVIDTGIIIAKPKAE